VVRSKKSIWAVVALCVGLGAGTLACEDEGGFEDAGEEVDETLDEAEDQVD
jgi:hypothetical protein